MRIFFSRRLLMLLILPLLAVWKFGCASTETLIAIEVNPLCVVLNPGESQQFDATIFIDSVDQGVNNAAVSWSVLGGDVNGVISQSGFYTSPNTVPPPTSQVNIIATSIDDVQKAGEATVILTTTPSPDPNPCNAPPFS